jgi:hypothetical protein
MSNNLFAKLQKLLPPSPVLVGSVLEINEDEDYSTVDLVTNQGTSEYAAGIATGSRIRARGTFVPVGAKAFVRDGVIESRAPDDLPVEIVIGTVVVPPEPLVFGGPIANQELTEGDAFSLALASYWTGGSLPLSWSVAGGVLPAGVTLNPATGAVAGTPTEDGEFTVRFRATDMLGFRADSNDVAFAVEEAAAPTLARVVGKLSSGQFQYSDDGLATWVNAGQSGTYQATFAYDGTTIVAAKFESSANNLLTSTDGASWTPRTTAANAKNTIAWGAGRFVTTRYETDVVEHSADGASWSSTTLPDFEPISGPVVNFVGGKFFVSCGDIVYFDTSSGAHSSDGLSWTAVAVPTLEPEEPDSEDPFLVATGAMLKVGSVWTLLPGWPSYEFLTTSNFSSFTKHTHGSAIHAEAWAHAVFDGTYWYFAGRKGVWRTSDGTTFTQVLSGSWLQVLLSGSTLVAQGTGGVRHSIDAGATWTTISGTNPGRGLLGVLA